MDHLSRRKNVILNHLYPSDMNAVDAKNIMVSTSFTSAESFQFTNISHSSCAAEKVPAVSYSVQADGAVAVLTINSPPANSLSDRVINGLGEGVKKAYEDAKVRAIVVTSSLPGFFVAGADIGSLQSLQNSKGVDVKQLFIDFCKKNNKFLSDIESGSKPAVAAIDGACLGGGLELAMGCNARICTPKSSLGLPELKLGLIPGFGGTQRLPRLVGVAKGLEMMLTSNPVDGKQALKIKLVDEVVEPAQLLSRAIQFALEMADKKRPQTKALYLQNRLEPADKLPQIFGFAEAQAKKNAPNLYHPIACINAIRAGALNGGEYGLDTEGQEFGKVAVSNTAKAMIHFFFAMRATSKVPGVSAETKARKIKKLAVIGGGTMGSGIAAAAMMSGITTVLKEVNQQFLDAGVDRIRGIFKSRLDKGKLKQEQYDKILALLKPSLTYEQFGDCDMVIEAVIEKMDLKQNIFADLEKHCSPTCILATNTSTLDIVQIGAKTKAQKRIIGLHFFSPAHIMKLLEIIRSDVTDKQIIVDSLGFAKQINKTPVVVGNCPGFVVNRVFFNYGIASQFLIDHGAEPYHIDEVVKKFGMPMGPFRMGDLSGIDVMVLAHGTIRNAFADRAYSGKLSQLLVDAKRLGEKTGAGYYKYEKGKAVKDPTLAKFLEESRKAAGNPQAIKFTDEEIIEIVFYPTVNEACRCMEEGIVYRASDIDIASVFGMGFPFFHGGLVKFADLTGLQKIVDRLNHYEKLTGLKMFRPCNLLRDYAAAGKSLFAFDKQ